VTKRLFWLLILAGVPSINAQTYWPPSLANCGSTCFINANLQLLYNIRPLTNHLTSGPNPFDETNAPTPYYYTGLIRKFEASKNQTKSVPFSCDEGLKQLGKICYTRIRQPEWTHQDASQLMGAFLNDLIEKSSGNLKANIASLFQVKEDKQIICPAIPEQKLPAYQGNHREEIQILLPVPVTTAEGKPLNTLDQCLDSYTKSKLKNYTVEGESEPRQICSQHTKLKNTSPILLIALNRFEFQPVAKKLDNPVTIPTTLNLSKYVVNSKNNHKFDLIGVVVHNGNLDYGHYWAYVKNGDQWYNCNDTSITKVSIVDPEVMAEINGKSGAPTGYILCYQKQLTEDEKRVAEKQRRAEERARKQKEEKERQEAERRRREAEEQRKAQERAAAEALRKQKEEKAAREKQREMAEQKRKIEEVLKAKQEAARKAEEQRKAAELKKLSDQLNLLARQLEGLNQSLSQLS
jgi:ubiquitin C-terminal hydrolase